MSYIKKSLKTLLIFAYIFLQSCTNQESVSPSSKDQQIEKGIMQRIKTLGFADNQIREMPDYYLADGDLYFPKKEISFKNSVIKKPNQPIQDDYFTLTIRLDKSLSTDIDKGWLKNIDQAITEWNVDRKVHFHFVITKSDDADINIVVDNNLPVDVTIASEFPRDGRVGSSIRINFSSTKVVSDSKQTLIHALEHCTGLLHSTSSINSRKATFSIQNSKNARDIGPRYEHELYAIQGDWVHRIDQMTGSWVALRKGWAGTVAMGATNGALYMVQFGTLIATNAANGYPHPLTNGWEGTQFITSIPGDQLYIMQNGWIYPTNPDTGYWGNPVGGKQWFSVRAMVGYSYQRLNTVVHKLAVLQPVNAAWDRVSIFSADTGVVENEILVPVVSLPGYRGPFWNGFRGLTYSRDLAAYSATENRIFPASLFQVYTSVERWANIEQVTGGYLSFFIISDGTLLRRDDSGMPVATLTQQLGVTGDWAGTSNFVGM